MAKKSRLDNRPKDIDAEEKWILGLLSGEKNGQLLPKYILGAWEVDFPDSDISRLRAAINSLREKGTVDVVNDGVLLLTRKSG